VIEKSWGSIVLCILSLGVVWAEGNVSPDRLVHSRSEPENWLTYSGTYDGWRYSTLTEIDVNNVHELVLQWAFQTGSTERFQATPLVADGIMYVALPNNGAVALDAQTGRSLWHYARTLPSDIPTCCGHVSRGVALSGNKVYMATLDGHLIALDSKTGNLVFDREIDDYRKGYSFNLAPLVVKNNVLIGPSGAEFGIRGYVDAFDTETGRRNWRFYTIPARGEPNHQTWEGDSWIHGGAATWLTGSYDPELNLVYWTTSNPGPANFGEHREGDNLYSCSVVALDADTGQLKWHFQFTPHDLHDWDANQIPVLVDLDIGGRRRKLLLDANRNGFFYVLDRTTGQFLFAKPYGHQTWAREIGADGRPVELPGSRPTAEGVDVCPGLFGVTNWMSPSYSPQTELFYVAAREECGRYFSSDQAFENGHYWFGGHTTAREDAWGALRALDPRTGQLRWEFRYASPPMAGVLSTAGALVFSADMEGNFMAFDARSGQNLWHVQTGAAIVASPMTYSVNGKQFVAIASQSALFVFGLSGGPVRVVSGPEGTREKKTSGNRR